MQDLRNRSDLRVLADLVADLHHCAPDADLMLVGAGARDVLLVHMHDMQPRRRTNDWDFAFAIPDWSAYEELKHCLDRAQDYTRDTGAEHRLLSPKKVPVDLIPFDGIEQNGAEIGWPPDGAEVMSVLGYREAERCAIDLLLPGEQALKIPTLPMQALLKLFAWQDRHQRSPRKDADDLNLLLQHSMDIIGHDRLLDVAPTFFDDPGYDHDLAAAWLVGYELRCCLEDVSTRRAHILSQANAVLAAQTDPEGGLQLIGELRATDPEAERRRLIAFHRGLHQLADDPFASESPWTLGSGDAQD